MFNLYISVVFNVRDKLETLPSQTNVGMLRLIEYFAKYVQGTQSHCNSVLFGLPANLTQRLQSAQNAAARLIFRIRRSGHTTSALIGLHWQRVPERIFFKLAVLTYRSIHGASPSYLQSCFTRVADMTSRRQLRSSASHRPEVGPFVTLQSASGRPQFS